MPADRAGGKIDRQVHFQDRLRGAGSRTKRQEFGPGLAGGDADWAANFEHPPRSVQFNRSGAIQQKYERRGGPVQNRNFRPVDLDQRVVDRQTGQGRHQMLDGADPGRRHGGIGQDSAQVRIGDVVKVRRDHAVQVGAVKNDTVIGGRGPNGEGDTPAGMDADADAIDRGLERPLPTARRDIARGGFLLIDRQSDEAIHPTHPVRVRA